MVKRFKMSAVARKKNAEKQREFQLAHPGYGKLQREKHWARKLIEGAKKTTKHRVARRGQPVTVTIWDLLVMFHAQDGKCYWLGFPMERTVGSHWRVSLDRLDNARGYTRDNVVLCTWFANRARGTMAAPAFRLAIARVRAA